MGKGLFPERGEIAESAFGIKGRRWVDWEKRYDERKQAKKEDSSMSKFTQNMIGSVSLGTGAKIIGSEVSQAMGRAKDVADDMATPTSVDEPAGPEM